MGRLLELVRQSQEIVSEKDEIAGEIAAILDRMGVVESALSLETDEDLIDAGIYEIKSLNCRYTYFLKQAKRLGITK